MRILNFTVNKEYDSRPLLHFLRGYIGLSSRVTQSIRHTENSVLINGKASRVVDKVFENDYIQICLPEKTEAPLLWDKNIDIIYEDKDLIVINKPAGISTHPTINHQNGTLANAVANYFFKTKQNIGAARTIGRLDKVTSGAIIFAKNSFTASKLNGKIKKIYVALVYGKTDKNGVIDAPIYRPFITKTIRSIDERGDKAITHYKTICQNEEASLVEVKIDTGRTHQIRLHLSYIGHPLIGDVMYGGLETEYLNRAALHCKSVSFLHPIKNQIMTFTVPIPTDMEKEMIKRDLTVDKANNIC